VVLLRDRDDRLLLVRQPPAEGWSLPGGLLDRREQPRDAAVREVREEIGVTLDPEAVTPIVPNAHVNPWVQQVDLIFTATVDADATALTVDRVEIGEARWFALDALPPLTGPTFRLLGRAGLVSPEASPGRPAPPADALNAPPDAAPTPSTPATARPPADPATPPAAEQAAAEQAAAEQAAAEQAAAEPAAASPPAAAPPATAPPATAPPATASPTSSATVMGAVLDGGAERTDAVLAEPGEAFADPEAPTPTPPASSQAPSDTEAAATGDTGATASGHSGAATSRSDAPAGGERS